MVGKTMMACGLAFALTALAAGPVWAMDADCLWRNIDAAERTALDAAIASGPSGVAAYDIDGVDGRAWRHACGVTSTTQDQAIKLLATFALEKSALSGLAATVPGSSEKLQAAWSALAPAERDSLVRLGAIMARHEDPPPADWEAIHPLVIRVSKDLGLTDKAQLELLISYIAARGMRAALEGA